MGVYLSKPLTVKESQSGEYASLRFAVAAMQGWRQYMEDAHIAESNVEIGNELLGKSIGIYGVFDGHGGPAVSRWVSRHFVHLFKDNALNTSEGNIRKSRHLPKEVALVCEALQATFLHCDDELDKSSSHEELRVIHKIVDIKREKDMKTHQINADGHPSIIRALLQGTLGSEFPSKNLKIVEQNGQAYLQVFPNEDDEEDLVDNTDGTVLRPEAGEDATDMEVETADENCEDTANGPDVGTDAAAKSEGETGMTSVRAESLVMEAYAKTAGLTDAISGTAPDLDLEMDSSTDFDITNKRNADPDCVDGPDELLVPDEFTSDDMKGCGESPAAGEKPPWDPDCCGCTAVVSVVIGGDSPTLITANAGDSRAVICRGGKAVAVTKDHKPLQDRELKRIHHAGGSVCNGRVDGNLNLSRSLGDLFYKRDKHVPLKDQRICAYPDVTAIPIGERDEFAILACDGIWDCKSNQEAVDFVRERLAMYRVGADTDDVQILARICEEMCDDCLAASPFESEGGIGCDNMTVLIVDLRAVGSVNLRAVGSVSQDDEPTFYGDSEEEEAYRNVNIDDPVPIV